MTDAIVAEGLTKTFTTTVRESGTRGFLRSLVAPRHVQKTAVSEVSFRIATGELVALLGPNGAGKSTTIKMLTGILTPTSGEVSVAGLVPHRDREQNARNVGAVFGQRTQLWWDLPAKESFSILRDIFGVPERDYVRRLADFEDLLDLSSFWATRVRHLSLGQRVRCDLAAALLHDPPIVFLDEPTIGMDAVVKEQVRQFLFHQVHQRGRTVLLTTHDMTEVERLADRVLLVNDGRIEMDGSLHDLRRRFGGSWRLRLTFDPSERFDLARVPGLVVRGVEGDQVIVGADGSQNLTAAEALRSVLAQFRVIDLAIEETDLEEVMRAAYARHAAPITEVGSSARNVD
jgi:ABC-2 type transport system ATP-binding protein